MSSWFSSKSKLNMHSREKHVWGRARSQYGLTDLLPSTRASNLGFRPIVNKSEDILDYIYSMNFLEAGLKTTAFKLHRASITSFGRRSQYLLNERRKLWFPISFRLPTNWELYARDPIYQSNDSAAPSCQVPSYWLLLPGRFYFPPTGTRLCHWRLMANETCIQVTWHAPLPGEVLRASVWFHYFPFPSVQDKYVPNRCCSLRISFRRKET